jgi:hypothetical protein
LSRQIAPHGTLQTKRSPPKPCAPSLSKAFSSLSKEGRRFDKLTANGVLQKPRQRHDLGSLLVRRRSPVLLDYCFSPFGKLFGLPDAFAQRFLRLLDLEDVRFSLIVDVSLLHVPLVRT